jgi:hypothetical protein
MIVIKTIIGATSIIATWYTLYLIGILTERYVLQEDEPEPIWIWPYVLRTLSGVLGVALLCAMGMCGVLGYMVGEWIWQCVAG